MAISMNWVKEYVDLKNVDLKEFAEMRNAYARKKGYPNYFE